MSSRLRKAGVLSQAAEKRIQGYCGEAFGAAKKSYNGLKFMKIRFLRCALNKGVGDFSAIFLQEGAEVF